jgi:tetratricopeptide (TPR) repeat protein
VEAGRSECSIAVVAAATGRTPDDSPTLLLAGKVAASNADIATAIDLVASIPIDSDKAVESTELLVKWHLSLAQYEEAVTRLQANLTQSNLSAELNVALRRQLWGLLNRLGRRQQASTVADQLCRSGYFDRDTLVSLLRRGDAFPLALGDDSPAQHFYPGLGMARWLFSQEKFESALKTLDVGSSPQPRRSSQNAAADALRGRLLAELQQTDDFVRWCRQCDPESQQYSDYWIALGIYFFDQQHLKESAGALLEGIYLDPTDDDGCHRLARVLAALQLKQPAALMREHAIRVATLKNLVKQLSLTQSQPELTADLPTQLLSIARPFEAIGWALNNLGPGNEIKRSALMQQLSTLRQDPMILSISSEYAMMDLDRDAFPREDVLKRRPRTAGDESNIARTATDSGSVTGETSSDPVFVDVAAEVGLDFKWYPNKEGDLRSLPMHEMMGGAIAVCDFDLDGNPDVYLGQGSGNPPDKNCSRSNQMYRNIGSRFLKVTEQSGTLDFGYSSGIAAGDINQDGFPDLYIGCLGGNRLLINNGDGSYRDATENLGDVSPQFTSSVAIADLTGDGRPELFECVYVEMEDGFRLPDRDADGNELPPNPNDFYAESDRWFLSQGNGAMILKVLDPQSIEPGTALGLVVTDIDGDGANDVFVANDARPNHLLMRFSGDNVSNVADLFGLGYGFRGFSNSCMGIASGDFNRDGRFDLHVTNFLNESNNFFLQGEGGLFSDYATRFGLTPACEPYTGFGIKKIDLDRNGWPDFVVSNGHVFDQRSGGIDFQMYPQVLMNEASHLRASDSRDAEGYFGKRHVGRSMASFDFDGDQDLDLIVGHLDSAIAVLENRTEENNLGVQFELLGTQTERDGIGCRVVVQFGGQSFTDWVAAGDGYLSTDESVLDFGIGDTAEVGHVEVHWPSGQKQRFDGIKGGKRYVIVEGNNDIWSRMPRRARTQR